LTSKRTRNIALASCGCLGLGGVGLLVLIAIGAVVSQPSQPAAAPPQTYHSPQPSPTQAPTQQQPAAPGRPQVAGAVQAFVVRVVDGDTLEVSIDSGGVEKVRLIGIDTPEKHQSSKLDRDVERTGQDKATIQALGELASQYTAKQLQGKRVVLEFKTDEKRDRYGRLLAYVRLADGTDFNEKIIRDGYANAYNKYPHPRMERYSEAEKDARGNRRGLWSNQAIAPAVTPGQTPQATGYVASKRSQVFHRAGCTHAKNIAPHNLIQFGTREEAVRSGRRPCKRCGP